jgi:hypothetical protein
VAHPHTRPEILAALEANARTLADYFAALPADAFFDGDSDRWSPAHHLAHLTATSAAITRGLRSGGLPAHPAGRSRSYAEVRDAAAASVRTTPKDTLLTMGRTVRIDAGASQAGLVDAFLAAGVALREAIAGWDEGAMDRSAMPHPLIGALTVREMLLFAVVHERHHLRGVQARV